MKQSFYSVEFHFIEENYKRAITFFNDIIEAAKII